MLWVEEKMVNLWNSYFLIKWSTPSEICAMRNTVVIWCNLVSYRYLQSHDTFVNITIIRVQNVYRYSENGYSRRRGPRHRTIIVTITRRPSFWFSCGSTDLFSNADTFVVSLPTTGIFFFITPMTWIGTRKKSHRNKNINRNNWIFRVTCDLVFSP